MSESSKPLPGFHIGGMSFHADEDAIGELAFLGFAVMAVRANASTLHPQRKDFASRLAAIDEAAIRHEVDWVIDLDAPYLRHHHRRSGFALCDDDPSARRSTDDWLESWASVIGDCRRLMGLTMTTGAVPAAGQDNPWRLAAEGLTRLVDRWPVAGAPIWIRPAHGSAIGSVADYLQARGYSGGGLPPLAADISEMALAGEIPFADRLATVGDDLAMVYLAEASGPSSDPQRRDRRVGCGDLSLQRIVRGLTGIGFRGPVIYRCFGHAEAGYDPAREAIADFESS